jgi:hypothetical protein
VLYENIGLKWMLLKLTASAPLQHFIIINFFLEKSLVINIPKHFICGFVTSIAIEISIGSETSVVFFLELLYSLACMRMLLI